MDGITLALTAFFNFAGKILDKMPDWLERKKDEYHKLLDAYNREWNRPTTERDGNLADKLRIDLETFYNTFWKELNSVDKK